MFAIGVVSPPPLGSASVSTQSNIDRVELSYQPLPETNGPIRNSRDFVWLRVIGTHKAVQDGLPVLTPEKTSLVEISTPSEPYE